MVGERLRHVAVVLVEAREGRIEAKHRHAADRRPAGAQRHEQVAVNADRLVDGDHRGGRRRPQRLEVHGRHEHGLSGLDHAPEPLMLGDVVRSCHVGSHAKDGVGVGDVCVDRQMRRDGGEPPSLRKQAHHASVGASHRARDDVEQALVVHRRFGERPQRARHDAKSFVLIPRPAPDPHGKDRSPFLDA